jgi:hypothetical protein
MAEETEDTMEKNRLFRPLGAVVVAGTVALALLACGGGNSASAPASPVTTATGSVPSQVSESVAALISWASTLPRSDTTEPLNTDAFHPPVDDGAEPTTIN